MDDASARCRTAEHGERRIVRAARRCSADGRQPAAYEPEDANAADSPRLARQAIGKARRVTSDIALR
ncbi:hypothetical protein WT27_01490 [Burkholderia territorii]|uniref:Uncharacterized protein n=1 Tax=Burkholderia territorii TaxID=1503055 RepID=A0A119DFX8_9BURK|nr:hypothetical protein WT27_01490 [Burkholderia territorii]KVX27230.1 hypothetical protein WT31_15175 [Burkholderia territorii]